MMFSVGLVLLSGFIMFSAADWLVKGIVKVAQCLRWSEFVVAFFIMAIGGSLPNLFVGLSSVAHGIPELSFGDVVGNSVIALTLVAALAVFVGSDLLAEGKLIQTSAFLTISIALLPLLLILDGELGRGDGIALIIIFFGYAAWMFSKRKYYPQTLDENENPPLKRFRSFLIGLLQILIGGALLLVAAEGVVRSASFFAQEFSLPIAIIGLLGLGFMSALPELYFAVAAAKKGKSWIILGQLTGSVIILSTLILGIVAILQPIVITDFTPFAFARFFLILAALFFLIFIRTGRRITKKEALVLVGIYLAFVAVELFTKILCELALSFCFK